MKKVKIFYAKWKIPVLSQHPWNKMFLIRIDSKNNESVFFIKNRSLCLVNEGIENQFYNLESGGNSFVT